MNRLVAIDPGTRALGVALFEKGTLAQCRLLRAHDLEDMIYKLRAYKNHADEVVVEIPVVYPASRSKGDPNNLIKVALAAGGAATIIGGVVRLVRPYEWKGNVPKDIHHKHIRQRLSPSEVEVLRSSEDLWAESYRHNIVDAVGIGLWRVRNTTKVS